MPRPVPFGAIRHEIAFDIPNQLLAGGALDAVTAMAPRYAFEVEDMYYVAHTVHTGASATKTFTLKRTVDTVATLVVAVAAVGVNGAVVSGATLTAGNGKYADTDTLTVSLNAGTAFTLGAGTLYVRVRQLQQDPAG